MSDIIVTTPKSQIAAAAQEAADVIAAGGGEYFRRFSGGHNSPKINSGDRVYYVEDGWIRGFAVVSRTMRRGAGERCATTGHVWPPGAYIYMDATSWKWIEPVPMRGFQGFRYAKYQGYRGELWGDHDCRQVKIVGGWRDPKPTLLVVEC